MRIILINVQTLPLPIPGNRLNNRHRKYSIRNKAKIKIIRDTVRATNPTIVILTETKHVSTEQATSFKLASNYTLVMECHNTRENRQGGILVMQKKGTAVIELDSVIAAVQGPHSVSVRLKVDSADIILSAVYGPNEATDTLNSEYFNEINSNLALLTHTGCETKIVAGDFNTVINEADSSSQNPLPTHKKLTRQAIINLMESHQLEDIALAHPAGQTHTWTRTDNTLNNKDKRQSSRLDRVLVTANTKSSNYETLVLPTFDHKAVSVDINIGNKKKNDYYHTRQHSKIKQIHQNNGKNSKKSYNGQS